MTTETYVSIGNIIWQKACVHMHMHTPTCIGKVGGTQGQG